MKSYIFKSVIFGVIALMLWSCKKDETRVVVADNVTAPVLEATYDNLVLTEDKQTEDALQLTWEKANYGYAAAVSYSIEIAKKDSSFARVASADMGSDNERIFTVGDLNSLISQLNVKGFEENELEIRIKADIGGGVAPVYSNVIPVTVTPYEDKPPYQTLYLVGDATPGGWDNGKASPVYRDPADAFVFTYTGYFNAGSFKFIAKPGAWTPMWGITDGKVAFRATEADPDPGSFSIPAAGYYTVSLSLKNNTFTMQPYDAGGKTVYESIGIIGAFNGWGSTEAMTHYANDPHNWTITHTFTEPTTEFKFRIAADWSANWGAFDKPTQTNPYGTGKSGGENYIIPAGTYLIIFNDMTFEYVFVKQ
ncbi:SusF/SusE family outer membrane protein [Mucilaginibacter limnophilus]|uniref:SusF/SusE family outer membrane protein n=1 Tax=Mucilaginibacter limnophilus TaxID=1932778 RepID=A0A3S2V2A8_9SPHI|nr:SusE domain-containing protein [Mucilaginibacter limnophilus]RVU01360.1 SusF/SusE family outer membrane protein [Mucilaginibacter limnophilus]